MADRRVTLAKLAEIVVLGAICGVLFLLFMPNVEQSRTEVMLAMAYRDVRRLHESAPVSAADFVSGELDPWGEPYRIQPLRDGGVRVLSTGPNRSTGTDPDCDDISSDMAESPTREISRKKRRRALLTFGCAAGAWVLGSALILRSRAG